MLFFHCFDPKSGNFMVTPHSLPSNLPRWQTVNFIVHLVTSSDPEHDVPVLVVDVKDDAWIDRADTRLKADDQIHQWFDAMLADSPLPRLWGLSLLGMSLRVYVGDVAARTVEPAFTDHSGPSRTLSDNLLEGAWNIDILSEEGFAKIKEIVADIIGNAATLVGA
ncbi:hypothetical protein OG21DRAFT_1509824 [Imleria badia]|nr:hypothetical protein OG21DRAFT_1509824 [Imleria badia]